jgi:hypothetical protein
LIRRILDVVALVKVNAVPPSSISRLLPPSPIIGVTGRFPPLFPCYAERKARGNDVPQESGFPSWFKVNQGVIGPPVAHTAGAAGMLSAMGLTHVLASMVYVSKSWSVVLILAGYAIPFAIARELVARRMRNFETNDKLSDGEG